MGPIHTKLLVCVHYTHAAAPHKSTTVRVMIIIVIMFTRFPGGHPFNWREVERSWIIIIISFGNY